MPWAEFASSIVGGIVTGGLLLPASVWVLRLWMANRFELEFKKRLEDHKLGLDKQLEIHKALLANITGRRVEVVVETYRLLVRAARGMKQHLDPLQWSTGDPEYERQLKSAAPGGVPMVG